jgi:hypothetical protein
VEQLHSFSTWLSETGFSQIIQTTNNAIMFIQVIHIICLSALFGCALILALRFMGRGIVSEPLQHLSARVTSAIWTLLIVLVISGLLLITAEPGRTITNPAFYFKMVCLVVVVGLTLWLARAARSESTQLTPVHSAVAVCTMLLWSGIIVAGRLIAYIESY